MKVSGYKIDEIADLLTAKMNEEYNKLEKELKVAVSTAIKSTIPKDALVFHAKYKDVLSGTKYVSFNCNGHDFSGRVECPFGDAFVDSNSVNFKNDSEIGLMMEQKGLMSKKIRETRNKIKCTLSKLGTYAQIKNQFPEAYTLLVEKVDKQEFNTSLCDDVESLRAQLNHSK